jgi:hypothetical protein
VNKGGVAMKNRKMLLPALLSIVLVCSLILPASAAGASVTVPLPDDRSISHLAVDSSSAASATALNTPQGQVTPMVAAGWGHTVGLKSDGTVVAVGNNGDGQCNVGAWTDIIQVAAGDLHTVGIKSDGTVVAVGDNRYGQCNVGGWTDIVQVAGGDHTVGVKADGTVVAVGSNGSGRCDVGGWTDIVQVAAGDYHTVGLKSDGTVVAAGPEAELAKWNLVLAVPPSQFVLTISSTAGGSVTTPGKGTFTYAPETVVDLVAEPEEGYRFVEWTGDVDTIANVNTALTTITMEGYYAITANFEEVPPVNWPLIGGIIAAVVAVGLVIFFVRRRRAA